jgi:hypothetical protein
MNRHERRRAKFARIEMIPADEIVGSMCAWAGCSRTFSGEMPPEWVWFDAYWAKRPADCFLDIPRQHTMRDAALCPEHARALDTQLKEFGRELIGPVAGAA